MKNFHFTVQYITDNGGAIVPAKSRRIDVYENDGVTLRGYLLTDGVSSLLSLFNAGLESDISSLLKPRIENLPDNTNLELTTISNNLNAKTGDINILTDGHVIGIDSNSRDELHYFGSANITIELDAGIQDGYITKIRNFGTGVVEVNSIINKANGSALVGSSLAKEGTLLKQDGIWYGYGDWQVGSFELTGLLVEQTWNDVVTINNQS